MKTSDNHTRKTGDAPEEEAILEGLREADRFYQGFQRQGNLGKLIEQVGKKLAREDRNPPSATVA
jgi:hypothetical protein